MKNIAIRLLVASFTFLMGIASIVYWAWGVTAYCEWRAFEELKAINRAQFTYAVTQGRGNFSDLQTLVKERWVDADLADGQKGGYIFTSKLEASPDGVPRFETTARPMFSGQLRMGNQSFYSNETGVVWVFRQAEPVKPDSKDRVPKGGDLVR